MVLVEISSQLYEVALRYDQVFYSLEVESQKKPVKINFDYNADNKCYVLIINIPESGKIIEDSYLAFDEESLSDCKEEFIQRLQEILRIISEQEEYVGFLSALEEHYRITQPQTKNIN